MSLVLTHQPPPGVPERRTETGTRRRFLFDWVIKDEFVTLTRFISRYQLFLAAVLLIFQGSMVAEWPPIVQGYFFTPPAWSWSVFLVIGTYWKRKGRELDIRSMRRNGSIFCMIILASLCGPLWMGHQQMCSAVNAFITFWQVIVVARLIRGLD